MRYIIHIQLGLSLLLLVILIYVLLVKKKNFQEDNKERSIKQGLFFITIMSTSIVSTILIGYDLPIFIYLFIWWFTLALPNIYLYNYFRNSSKWVEVYKVVYILKLYFYIVLLRKKRNGGLWVKHNFTTKIFWTAVTKNNQILELKDWHYLRVFSTSKCWAPFSFCKTPVFISNSLCINKLYNL